MLMHALRHFIHRSALLLMLAAVALSGQVGCESMSRDVADLFEPFNMPAPGEAARWMYDRNPDLRRRGVTLIYASPFGGEEAYVKQYADMVRNDPDPLVRAAAVRALARHGTPDHAVLIAEQLTHESIHVRWEAAKGMQRLHNPAVVPVLTRVLNREGEEVDVRAAVATALGQYPSDDAAQELMTALDAPELVVNRNARDALATMTGQNFGLDRSAWFNWYTKATAPFADRQEYRYPVYQRDDTLLENIAFWTKKNWEEPGTPVGLNSDARRTYEGGETPGGSSASSSGTPGG